MAKRELCQKAKFLDLLVDLCSYSHLWSRAWGSDRKNGTAGIKWLKWVAGLFLRDRVRSSFKGGREVVRPSS